jgi:EAL domain-containing protein (putative c-di-GMP-specific phosphodiesterase class I)/GGDEF domain-containing protein
MAPSPPAAAASDRPPRPSGRTAESRLAAHVRRARASGERVAVVTLAIENADAVAATIGSEPAAALLRELVAGIELLLGRSGEVIVTGAAELVVVQPLLGGLTEARALAHRLSLLADGPVPVGGGTVLVRARLGVAILPDDAIEPTILLRDARIAARHADCDPRRQPQFFLPEMSQRLVAEQVLAQELRQSLDDGQLALAYQPQLSLGDGRLFAAEALLRWRHPSRGWVSPGEFVPVAERSGLIDRLGRWVLREACHTGAAWRGRGVDLRMAVNLSPAQLSYPEIVDEVMEALGRSALPPQALVLEVTESVMLQDMDMASRALEQLRRHGVAISLDDFGSGHSGIGYLRELPLDQLKIDRCLIDGLGDGDAGASLAPAVVAMGRSLGLEVLAEGIETAAQMAAVQRLGCDAAQGYLIARPMAAGALGEAFASPRSRNAGEVLAPAQN